MSRGTGNGGYSTGCRQTASWLSGTDEVLKPVSNDVSRILLHECFDFDTFGRGMKEMWQWKGLYISWHRWTQALVKGIVSLKQSKKGMAENCNLIQLQDFR